jgi:hypothetical protein
MAVDKTVSGIDNAAQLIDSGKYYEGNQALKAVEDGTRFDVVDASSTPKAAAAANKASSPANQKDSGNATSTGSSTSGAASSTTATPSNNK